MQKRIFQFIYFSLCFSQSIYAAGHETINSCPDVILCRTGDNSKQTYTAYEQNQKAYQCYYKFGDASMAKIAGNEMVRCQTMYGSINPTFRKD